MIFARPSADEERWIALAERLRGTLDPAALAGRDGGWRTARRYARAALFVAGVATALLIAGITGLSDRDSPLVAGVTSLLAAEWLIRARRLHASGIEEGLAITAAVMLAAWAGSNWDSAWLHALAPDPLLLLAGITVGIAGVRLCNPLATAGAVLLLVGWVGERGWLQAVDDAVGGRVAALLPGVAVAALALVAGAREYRRPSSDRTLDWLVVAAAPVGWLLARSHDWVPSAQAAVAPRAVTIALLGALATASLAVGLRRRTLAPLLGAVLSGACAAIELGRLSGFSVEARMVIGGLTLLATAAFLERWLRTPRGGFTSLAPDGPGGPGLLLESAGAAAMLAPGSPPADGAPGGQGGRFGGGGASGQY